MVIGVCMPVKEWCVKMMGWCKGDVMSEMVMGRCVRDGV